MPRSSRSGRRSGRSAPVEVGEEENEPQQVASSSSQSQSSSSGRMKKMVQTRIFGVAQKKTLKSGDQQGEELRVPVSGKAGVACATIDPAEEDRLVGLVMREILLNNANKVPTTLKSIRDALGRHAIAAPQCLKKAQIKFRKLFGYDLKEVPFKHKDIEKFVEAKQKNNNQAFRHNVAGYQKTYILCHFEADNKVEASEMVVDLPGPNAVSDQSTRGLLFLILGFILLQDGALADDMMWKQLEALSLPASTVFHPTLGNVKYFIETTLVKQQYLERRKPIEFKGQQSAETRWMYQWGPRAYLETSFIQVYEWLSLEILGHDADEVNPLVLQNYEELEQNRLQMLNEIKTATEFSKPKRPKGSKPSKAKKPKRSD